MNLEALNKFVQNIDSFLSDRLLNIVKEKFSDDKIKALRLPDCLSSNQLECLYESLSSDDSEIRLNIMADWFYPNTENISIIRSSKKIGLNDSASNVLVDNRSPICLKLQSVQSIKDLLLKFSINKLKKQTSRLNDQQQQQHQQRFGNSNFNLFTYFDTKPTVPKFIHKQCNDGSSINIVNNEIENRLLTSPSLLWSGSSKIQILNGLSKNDCLDLLIQINNDCSQKQQSCRIVYLQSSTIMTFWMALAIKQMANDKWNSIGYQIMLESKTSLNNSIIFFEIATFIRALTRDLDMSLLTHLIIDVNDLTSLFFNLFLLFLKENIDSLKHLNIIFLTQDSKRSQKMIDYFGPNIFYSNMAERNSIDYNISNLQYFFLDDLQRISIATNSCEIQHENEQVTTSIHENHSELIIYECWIENVEINKMIEFFQMFPWQINYQCKRIEGVTPLITAIVRGNHSNVYQLLRMGADPCIPSMNGLEPIQWAIQFRRQQSFQLLFVHLYTKNESFNLHIHRHLNFSNRQPQTTVNTSMNKSYSTSYSVVNYDLILQLLYNMIKQLYHNHWSTMGQSSIGSILIMLPSYNHVSTLRKLIISSMIEVQVEFTIFCLYPNVPNNELDAGIEISSSSNHIRVILSTFNVDSILFKDIIYIINTGNRLMKMPNLFSDVTLYRMVPNPTENMETKFLLANNQKFPVIIWNLYRRNEFFDYEIDSMNGPFSISSNDSLYHCIFAAKCFEFKNTDCLMDIFNRMILPPNKEIIYRALNFMRNINVLDMDENLTTLGQMLIDISIEPHYAKMIIFSILLRCLDPILTIVCALSSPKSLYQQLQADSLQLLDEDNQQDEFHSIRNGMNNSQMHRISKISDHLNFVYAFQKWQEICRLNAKSYSSANHIFSKTAKVMINKNEFKESFATFEMIYSLRTKILGQLRAIGLVKGKGLMNIRYLNSNSDNFSLILAAITAGQVSDHFAQIINSENRQFRGLNFNEILYMEPNSILNVSSNNIESKGALILFDRKIQCGQMSYLQNCTIISPLTFILFIDDNSMDYNCNKNCIECMNGQFEIHNDDDDDKESGNELEKLFIIRQRWQQLVQKRIINMQQVFNEEDENFIENMINLITVADESYGFGSHPNIGRAPQVMSTYFCSTIRIKK
uniref:3'-5' RNA helicase YTHDC2-like n=1 Tax=Dermatophagoides pteronyssinus TaxID=6956 RepID=A0A6P6XYX0_DERPT|nr:3'-5' RNA helicase YTHDC2-like [Dermatophagoides pteronyssinus]